MKSVLFVCTANLCRSPLAQGLFHYHLGKSLDGWKIDSAGIWAEEGNPPSSKTLQILREKGIALSDQRSKRIERSILEQFALVLTMEKGQKEALQIEFPEHREKIFLLSEMVGRSYDIADPVGGDLEDYRRTAEEIDRILSEGLERIAGLAEE